MKTHTTKAVRNPTRRHSGRRIDTWIYHLPDGLEPGRIEVEIIMHSNQSTASFEACFNASELAHLKPSFSDIETLSSEIQSIMDHYVEEKLGDNWTDASLIRTSVNRHGKKDPGYGFTLDVDITPARLLLSSLSSNTGIREVIINTRRESVVERAADTHPDILTAMAEEEEQRAKDLKGASQLSAKIKASRFREDKPESRAVLPCNGSGADSSISEKDIGDFLGILEDFGRRLEAEMSPDALRAKGLPDRKRLIELLKGAGTGS